MDYDTEEALKKLPEQVGYLGLNLARFSILTPIPGTPLYEKMDAEGRITDKDWDHYTQHRAVFSPTNMSPEKLEEIYRQVWKETYSFRNIFRRVSAIPTKGLLPKLVGLGANIGFKYLGID